ncbi:hypothetical protein FPQ13_08605 [Allobacillus salarius]|uniref:Uncharacterized protein n=2 Tax=Bacillaceae TaxID=186817 RepID=A0A556PH18_9BACI|nr:hypothetical protein FPQ13_08605 [Allobacillus salarius]
MTVKQIGDRQVVSEDNLYQFVYKNIGLKSKLKTKVNKAYVKEHLANYELIYHPMWLAKTIIIAERPPFTPKKLPNIIFVDAVSGYRGVFQRIPVVQEIEISQENVVKNKIRMDECKSKYIKDVQAQQIDRSYILKKPKHEIVDLFLVYLPIWRVTLNIGSNDETFYINANTGENETYMRERWENGKDLI